MAADKGISDDELRRRLQGYGEDVPPVTAQTRPYLLRKLKRFDQGSQTTKQTKKTPQKSAKKSESFNPRRSSTPSRRLIGFSSDEETESEATPSKRSKISPGRGRRSEAITSPPAESERSVELSRRPIKLIADSSNENSLSNSFGNASLEKTSVLPSVSKAYQRRSKIAVDETDSGSSRKYRFAPWDSERGSQQRRDMQAGGLLHFEQAKRLSSDIVNIVSVIVAIVCIVILFAYALQSPSFVVTSQVRLPLCAEHAVTNEKKPKDCIKLDDAANIYIDYLYDVLTHKKGAIECQDGDGDGELTNSSISVDVLRTRIRQDNESRNPKDQEKILNKTLEQIRNNSHWKIQIHGIKGEEVLESEVAIKSISCRVKEALSRIAMRVILVVVVLCCLLAFYYFVRNRWRREEEETRLMYHFVEKILDILHNHHLECKKDKDLIPYLPIPHVRDMIIAPVDRQNLLKVWNKAVRFLSANESRVRVESQRIAGEDFEVWRWIQTTGQRHQQHHKMSLSASLKTKQGKVWQGQAFENFQSAVNPPIISPTPCLKIRNMFDPDVEANENWHVVIQDAILEKCSENNASVVHIAVDKSSSEGCVYVKCDTHASAGFAFRSLHGCWFDGRLVAVKYLTLKRYHQRFPMALEATVPLRPSGTTPSSLVTFNPEAEDDVEPEVNDSDFEA